MVGVATTILLVLVLAYLLISLTYVSARRQHLERDTFVDVRSEEIQEEFRVGRISEQEAEQLQKDLQLEASIVDSKQYVAGDRSRRLPQNLIWGLALIVCVGSVLLYQHLGYATEWRFAEKVRSPESVSEQEVADFLFFRTQKYGRPEDWYLLARGYLAQNDLPRAIESFEQALNSMPEDMENQEVVWSEYAEALFFASDRKVTDKLDNVLNRALVKFPEQPELLGLKGISQFSKQSYREAILTWQKAIKLEPNREIRAGLLTGIRKARQEGGVSEKEIPSLVTHRISINVVLNSTDSLAEDSVLLIYAKAPSSPMPVAITRLMPRQGEQLVELTNLDNVMPGASLDQVSQVDIIAKLSRASDQDLTQGKEVGRIGGVSVSNQETLLLTIRP